MMIILHLIVKHVLLIALRVLQLQLVILAKVIELHLHSVHATMAIMMIKFLRFANNVLLNVLLVQAQLIAHHA